jgi:hypothetical protein
MTTLDISRDWLLLLRCLPEDYEQLAVEHKQVQTQFGNAKITTAEMLLRLLFIHVGADLPLRQTVALMGGVGFSLSPNRLHMKMRRAVPYLGALLERMCPARPAMKLELWGGYDMCVLDASSVSCPGSTGTDGRIHAMVRLSTMRVVQVRVTDVTVGETFRNFSYDKDQLVIADRGYSKAPGIAQVLSQGADVLVRLNRGALPVFDPDAAREEDALINVIAWVRTIPAEDVFERTVYAEHNIAPRKTERIAGRLVAVRLPPEQAAQARKRARDEQGSEVTAETLEMAGYVVLFTTTTPQRLSKERCLEAYCLRWQVELLFKRWKSLGGLDRVPNERSDTTLSWLTVKLILGLIVERLSSAQAELSPPVRLVSLERAPRRPRGAAQLSAAG